MVAWGPIIGAGISALGSLFGKDDDEKVVRQEVDYEAMARNAEKAGFNPLTAIRNGGSAGFTNTIHPALSSAAGFGEAFATLGNALMSFDARADERAALEDRLMQAQISALNRSGEAASRSFAMDTPSAAGSTRVGADNRPINPPKVGNVHPYGEPQPLYRTVWWLDENGQRQEQHIANIDVVPDEITGLGTPAAVRFGNEYDRSRTMARPMLKLPSVPKPTIDPRNFKKQVDEWFKPWEGVIW